MSDNDFFFSKESHVFYRFVEIPGIIETEPKKEVNIPLGESCIMKIFVCSFQQIGTETAQ
jgi:hypothetical protein